MAETAICNQAAKQTHEYVCHCRSWPARGGTYGCSCCTMSRSAKPRVTCISSMPVATLQFSRCVFCSSSSSTASVESSLVSASR